MPAIILIIGLVSLPLVVVGCFITAYFKLRHRQFYDIERQNTIDGIVMQGLERISWPLGRPIVPTHVAPVAKPLPNPSEQIKGIGGGFVEAYGTGGGEGRSGREYERSNEGLEQAQIYGGRGHEWNEQHLPQGHLQQGHPTLDMPSNVRIDIQAPQPAYTHVNYGRFNSTQNPAAAMYGEDARAADAWDRIDRRESLAKPRLRSQPIELAAEEFEDVDLGDSKERRQDKRPATPVVRPSSAFTIGSDEEEEVEREDTRAQEQEVKQEDEPAYPPDRFMDKRNSDTTVATQTPCHVLPGISQKASWSTTSSYASRRSSELTRLNILTNVSRQSSMRESPVTPSRKSSTMGKLRSLTRRSSEMSRQNPGEVE